MNEIRILVGYPKGNCGELSIDLSSAVIIPDNLKASARRKFIRDNPNALTQEEFDRIKEKQDANKQEDDKMRKEAERKHEDR